MLLSTWCYTEHAGGTKVNKFPQNTGINSNSSKILQTLTGVQVGQENDGEHVIFHFLFNL